jgi:hypothetical protein
MTPAAKTEELMRMVDDIEKASAAVEFGILRAASHAAPAMRWLKSSRAALRAAILYELTAASHPSPAPDQGEGR